jgi:hypothetical protein
VPFLMKGSGGAARRQPTTRAIRSAAPTPTTVPDPATPAVVRALPRDRARQAGQVSKRPA